MENEKVEDRFGAIAWTATVNGERREVVYSGDRDVSVVAVWNGEGRRFTAFWRGTRFLAGDRAATEGPYLVGISRIEAYLKGAAE